MLVVGDSLQLGTGPLLQRELGGREVTVDARRSRPSSEGVSVLRSRLRPSHRVVVFDLGTNDNPSQTGRLASNLESVRGLTDDRCLVLATLSRPPVGGVPISGLNRMITRFASSGSGIEVVDWHAETSGDRSLLNRDGVHPTPSGYAVRARLLAQAVRSCLEGGGQSGERPDDVARDQPRGVDADPAPAVASVDWRSLVEHTPYAAAATYVRGGAAIVAVAVSSARESILQPDDPEPVLGVP